VNAAAKRRYRRGEPGRTKAVLRERRKRIEQYGLTVDDYAAMLIEQAGLCSLCGEPMKMPHLDHDHETGFVRGLLCARCNLGLGYFKDSEELLQAALVYLRRRT